MPPIITVPLSKTSGLSVDVLSKIAGNSSIALYSERISLSDNTQCEFYASFFVEKMLSFIATSLSEPTRRTL